MIKHNQDGAVSGLAISLILAVVLLLASVGFGFWAFSSRQDYKDHSDAKVAAAVKTAVAQESAVKDKQFAEESKNPLKTYNGPEALGSLSIQYPKTWSGYVDTTGSGGVALNGYFNPGVVPSSSDQNSVFALHVQVINQSYSNTLTTFANQQQQGSVTITAYALPKLPNVVGVKATGKVNNQKTGTVILLPLRSQTIEIATDGDQFLGDFNNYILKNFSFSP
jgi:hypothetical protein